MAKISRYALCSMLYAIMRILDKYIIRAFLIPFFYCLFLFIFLYIIIDLFGHLDEILRQIVSLLILQEYYLSMLPLIIMHTTPLSALISTIYVISTMNRYDEITAMRTAGINIFRILAPFIYTGLAISIIVFLISEKVLPISMKNVEFIKTNYIEKEKQTQNNKNSINNIALYGKNNSLIFIENYDGSNNTIKGVTILEQNNLGNVVKKTNAQEGEWVNGKWLFLNILIYKLDEKSKVKGGPLFFEEKSLDIESPEELISKSANYEFMSFKDLSSYIQNFSNSSPDITNRLRVDLHQKISFPFTTLIIIFIASGFAIRIRPRGKATAIMGIGISILIGFIYYALMATSLALGKGGVLPPILSAHLANIVFGLVGLVLIRN